MQCSRSEDEFVSGMRYDRRLLIRAIMMPTANIADPTTKPEGYYAQARPEMLPFIPKDARRILDVGCSEGRFAAQVKDMLGAEVWGIEFVPAAAEAAQQKLDRVLVGDVMEKLKELPDQCFDCIIFNDVLEHLVDPYSVLLKMKNKLSPSGVVVASIPNVRYFRNLFNLVMRGAWEYQDSGPLDKTHLRFFTKKSIHHMFQSLGYRVVRLEGINATPSWKVALFNLLTVGFFSDTRYLQFCCVAQSY
jgi:2-polyprenyl-3-methyl-5-hydroxy-6-metoxy-1,4-benzoquinol methylase